MYTTREHKKGLPFARMSEMYNRLLRSLSRNTQYKNKEEQWTFYNALTFLRLIAV